MFIQIPYITKINLAHLNGGEGAGNIITIKKISDYEGNEYAYISGQALRRYIKETLRKMGKTITTVDKDGNPNHLPDEDNENIKEWFNRQLGKKKNKDIKKTDNELLKEVFQKYIDLDLFGYMFPKGERRWSPVKVSPAVSILPWKGESDFLTRKQLTQGNDKSANIVNVEIDSNNYMKGNILIDKETVGYIEDEFDYTKKLMLEEEKNIEERVNTLIKAIKNLSGGAMQSRNLEDISPSFMLIIEQKNGNPYLLNTLKVDVKGNINIDEVIKTIDDYGYKSGKYLIKTGIFNNEEEVVSKLKEKGFTKLDI